MTDESGDLEAFGPDSYILQFIGGFSNNYAYIVFSPTTDNIKTETKVKGITLNFNNSKKLNFDLIKNMVIGPETPG